MSKDFNVYKWRREHLTESFDIKYDIQRGDWRDERTLQTKPMRDPETGENNVMKDYDGYFRIKTRGQFYDSKDSYDVFGADVKKMIEGKGYTFVGNSATEGDSLVIFHEFYYLK
jgi:hypothetical protein